VIYLTLPELLQVAERTLGADYTVRDYGLLEARLSNPCSSQYRCFQDLAYSQHGATEHGLQPLSHGPV
jgi:hypothetical protein